MIYIVDDHRYETDGSIPDLGSLVGSAQDGNPRLRSYVGLLEDKDKLPIYDDLMTGSSATLMSASGTSVFMYVAADKTWYEM